MIAMPTDRSDAGTDPTLAAPAETATTLTSPADAPADAPKPQPTLTGYRIGDSLGHGGMGEVVVAHDPRIGRDIAIKRMRVTATAELRSRFLREARVQARLDHPAIVPVHEIGEAADGSPYFTMKRVAGTTLLERMAKEPSQHLLRALVDVALAIDFAHARGVVHRDVKPANIILGGFGEVYVLDWGVARVLSEAEVVTASDVDTPIGMTSAGAMLGTPGYMAPEQVRDATRADRPADVYAIGAILFEILAREPLHPRGMAALSATVAGGNCSPRARAPAAAVPPELDVLCVDALALDPAARPTARELADRLQRYLDGDRDVNRRKALSDEHLALARAALADGDAARSVEALRHAGSAVAMYPDSREAVALFARILLEPPRVQPPELRAALAASETATQRRQSRVAATSFLAIVVFLVAVAFDGVNDWALWLAMAGWTGVMAWSALHLARRSPGTRTMMVVVCGNALLAVLLSRVFGSLIVTPSAVCIMALSLTSYPQLIDRGKLVMGILLASWLAPVALESLGVFASTWQVEAGYVHVMSSLGEIGGASTTVLLVGSNVLAIAVIGRFANALAGSRRDAQRAIEIQAWHMRQLVPTDES
jgi:serine/threonine-protein kinase